ncbi:hypothetical protein [Lacrimispora sp. JR3]|uniref:hypothetical protein n=1 Tax=Lacrimispora sinapis TaxID=3111456 RepID=UPI0037494552
MEAENMENIAQLFRNLRFKKKLFGGVDEKDVWKKLDTVQKEYRAAYEMQRERYEARLQERDEIIALFKEMQKHPQESADE